jgi:uncharacterized protein YaiE (UPF0345 family)
MATTGAMPTTAASVKVSTGTVIKTLLQIQTSATRPLLVTEWGISFDGNVANVPIQVELIDTYAIAATVTAHVAAGVQAFDALSDTPASTVTLGTGATGYNASAEGTITQTRYGDLQLVAPTNQYVKQFPLGREFYLPVSHNLRVRVTSATSVNAYAYVIWQE